MKIDIDDFTTKFKNTFDSFLSSCPLEVLPEISKVGVTLYIRYYLEGHSSFIERYFPFDFDVSVKDNIFKIKTSLVQELYPVLTKEVTLEKEVSPEKKLELLKQGVLTASTVANYKEYETVNENYVLVRIIQKDRTLHLLKDGDIYTCNIEAPLYYFRTYLLSNMDKANKVFKDSQGTLKKLVKENK